MLNDYTTNISKLKTRVFDTSTYCKSSYLHKYTKTIMKQIIYFGRIKVSIKYNLKINHNLNLLIILSSTGIFLFCSAVIIFIVF